MNPMSQNSSADLLTGDVFLSACHTQYFYCLLHILYYFIECASRIGFKKKLSEYRTNILEICENNCIDFV